MSVTAFDSGVRVVVEIEEAEGHDPLQLSIGEEGAISLSVEEAQRIIDGLTEGLARLARMRAARPARD